MRKIIFGGINNFTEIIGRSILEYEKEKYFKYEKNFINNIERLFDKYGNLY